MQNHYNSADNFKIIDAGFFPRVGAYLIDLIILGMTSLIVVIPVGFMNLFNPTNILNRSVLFQFNVVDIALYLAGVTYFILLTYKTGATLGKRAMNIVVISTSNRELRLLQVVYRETIGRYLSAVVLCVGYLVILVDKSKRGFHDMLADTAVVYEKKVKVTYQNNFHRNQPRQMMNGVQPLHTQNEVVEIEKDKTNEDIRF